jgi:hypothetical protein
VEVCVAFVVASTAVGELVRARPRPARVAATGPAAVYLEVLGRAGSLSAGASSAGASPGWVALLARDAVRVPIGLVTTVPRDGDPFAGIRAGAAASIGGGVLRVATTSAGDGDLVYRPVRYWDPAAPRLCGALATLAVHRRAGALALLTRGLPGGDQREWPERAALLEEALTASVPPADRVAEAVRALAGLGPGLTPAGDDVLAGALVTLAAAADEPRRQALAGAVRDVLPRTAPVSAALLGQACHGRTIPELSRVLRALAGSGDLGAALGALGRVGHTSGAALALGVRAALVARAGRVLRTCA